MPEIIESGDQITSEEANKHRLLIMEDLAYVRLERAKALAAVSNYDANIAKLELDLADIARRVVGVTYKAPEQKPEEAK